MKGSKLILTISISLLLILSVLASVIAIDKSTHIVEVRYEQEEDSCSGLFCFIKRLILGYDENVEINNIETTNIIELKSLNLGKFNSKLIEKLDKGEEVDVWVRTRKGTDFNSLRSKRIIDKHPGLKQKYTVGYTGKLSLHELKELEDNPDVIEVIEDGYFYLATNDAIPLINADDVHLMDVGGEFIDGNGQNICVVDSGIDYTNVELGPKYIGGYDFIDDDNDPLNLADAHGTVISGIAGRTAPGSKIVAVRACDDTRCQFSEIGAAVEWCNDNKATYGISVIQMSIQNMNSHSPGMCPDFIDVYLEEAYNNDILTAVCSGNQGSLTGIGYPSCSPYATSVGGTTDSDGLYINGNRGPNLDIMAPAVLIRSVYFYNGSSVRTGTSVATPFVAGAAALVKQFAELHNYSMSAQEVEDLLKETGKIIDDTGSGLSFPRVDVLAAIEKLNYSMRCNDTDGDRVCDTEDNCIRENQTNLPSSTICTKYIFDGQTGCHDTTYESPAIVCGAVNCPDDQCVGKDWYEYTSMENRYCDGAGSCENTTCIPSIFFDNLYCDHDVSVDEFYVNNSGAINTGDIVTAVVTISNNGANKEDYVNYTLVTGSSTHFSGIIITMDPGVTRTGDFKWIYDSAGNFTPIFTIDPKDGILEYNETNNEISDGVQVN